MSVVRPEQHHHHKKNELAFVAGHDSKKFRLRAVQAEETSYTKYLSKRFVKGISWTQIALAVIVCAMQVRKSCKKFYQNYFKTISIAIVCLSADCNHELGHWVLLKRFCLWHRCRHLVFTDFCNHCNVIFVLPAKHKILESPCIICIAYLCHDRCNLFLDHWTRRKYPIHEEKACTKDVPDPRLILSILWWLRYDSNL